MDVYLIFPIINPFESIINKEPNSSKRKRRRWRPDFSFPPRAFDFRLIDPVIIFYSIDFLLLSCNCTYSHLYLFIFTGCILICRSLCLCLYISVFCCSIFLLLLPSRLFLVNLLSFSRQPIDRGACCESFRKTKTIYPYFFLWQGNALQDLSSYFPFFFLLTFMGWKICSSFIIGSICNFWDPFNCKCVFSALEVWSILPQNIWDWFLRHRGFNNLRVTGKLGLRFAAWFGEWCDWLVKSLLLCCLVIIWSPPLISTAKPAWAFY